MPALPTKQNRSAPAAAPHAAPGTPIPLPREIGRALQQVSRRALRIGLAECVAALAGVLPGLWLLQGLADRAFNLPWIVRLLLLAGDMAALGWILYAFAWLPLRRRLTPQQAAILVERKLPVFRSALVSAVELTSVRPGWPQGSPALVRALTARVAARLKGMKMAREVISSSRARKWARGAALPLLLFCAAWDLAPESTGILARRILLSEIPLPTRTRVAAVTQNLTVPVGSDVVVQTRAHGVIPRNGSITITHAKAGRESLPVSPEADDPSQFSLTLKNVQQSFRYRFQLNDGDGMEYRVTVLQPPAVATCRFVQSYPAYTGLRPAEMSAGNLSLLAGSRLQVEAASTLPLNAAQVQFESGKTIIPLAVSGADKRMFKGEFTVPKEGLSGFAFQLVSAEGAHSVNNTLYRVDFVPDNPPKVEWASQAAERATLLLRSRPALAFTAKDDFGIRKVALHYEITRPAASSGAEPPPAETGEIPLPPASSPGSDAWSYRWEPARELPRLVVGCTVLYWIEATDNNDVTGPGKGQSGKRTLVFVSEEEKKAELLEALGVKAADIEGIYNAQKKVNEDLDSTIRKTR